MKEKDRRLLQTCADSSVLVRPRMSKYKARPDGQRGIQRERAIEREIERESEIERERKRERERDTEC